MERNIPDVRDIFYRHEPSSKPSRQDIRSYDYSPRSRRRQESIENYDYDSRSPSTYQPPSDNRSGLSNKKSSRHRNDDLVDHRKKTSESSRGKEYSSKTLTERDIRHLERHLSMKKTIRKQISRNLAQAFVDEPDFILKDTTIPVPKNNSKTSQQFTLTRAKVSKSEQNVLDLLKDNEPDSGHCSADNPTSSDDDTVQDNVKHHRHVFKPEKVYKEKDMTRNKHEQQKDDGGKFSFWKMFTTKNKGRR